MMIKMNSMQLLKNVDAGKIKFSPFNNAFVVVVVDVVVGRVVLDVVQLYSSDPSGQSFSRSHRQKSVMQRALLMHLNCWEVQFNSLEPRIKS
jgi:hypothetical protein